MWTAIGATWGPTIRDSESIHGNVKSYFLFSMVVMACKEINSQRERERD